MGLTPADALRRLETLGLGDGDTRCPVNEWISEALEDWVCVGGPEGWDCPSG